MFSKGLILASTSRYRRDLLGRLRPPLRQRAARRRRDPPPRRTRIGDGRPPGPAQGRGGCTPASRRDRHRLRPGGRCAAPRCSANRGTVERCREQLQAVLGPDVVFLTAVHVIDGPSRRADSYVDRTTVLFRDLVGRRDRPLHRARPAARLRRRVQGRIARHRPVREDRHPPTRLRSPACRSPGSAAPCAARGCRCLESSLISAWTCACAPPASAGLPGSGIPMRARLPAARGSRDGPGAASLAALRAGVTASVRAGLRV